MIIIDDPSVIRTPAMAVARRKLEGEIVARAKTERRTRRGERERGLSIAWFLREASEPKGLARI